MASGSDSSCAMIDPTAPANQAGCFFNGHALTRFGVDQFRLVVDRPEGGASGTAPSISPVP
jgi:hypothetical protein